MEQVDMSKLTPAPWEVAQDDDSGGILIAKPNGTPMLLVENDSSVVDYTALRFAALARNAFDVMMRRGWGVYKTVLDEWAIVGQADASWPDPFTALVEADKWYKANIEKEM